MLDRFQRLADFYRFVSTLLVAMVCVMMHFDHLRGVQMAPAAKAPILALCAAMIFLTEFLPKKTWYSPLIARIAGTATTFLAAWNWVLDESSGDVASIIPPQFGFIFMILGVFAVVTLLITVTSDDSNQRKTEDEKAQEDLQ